jgi:hypothetical protein
MGMLLYTFVNPVASWLEVDVWTRCAWLAASVIGGALAYFGALLASGLRPSMLRLAS